MKSSFVRTVLVLILTLGAVAAYAQNEPQIINVPLSTPGDVITLDIDILSARIEVIGEDREDAEFAVSVAASSRNIITPSGAKALTGGAYSLEIDENDNTISVDTDWRANKFTIVARIPGRANLELSTTNDGEILVDNIAGHMQLENVNGPITATNVSGSVIAETVNDTIDISFTRIDEDSAMSLNSINGDLIFGLPADAGAQFHLDSGQGEIYSDFEVEVQPTRPVIERRNDRGGVEVRVESAIVVEINGGGSVIQLKTLNGDIQIRKVGN